jgi:uncharacterized protein YggU (UPF0235/DUF167 family)
MRRRKVIADHCTAIEIKLCAPAVEGKATAALRSLLAEKLKIPERAIVSLTSGEFTTGTAQAKVECNQERR